MAGIRTDSLYVSNLSYGSDNDSLKRAFPSCVSADVVIDRNSNKSKGYGFVRFPTAEEAQSVLDGVGGAGGTRNIDGRDVKINYAHNKSDSGAARGGFGGGRGGRGGGRGGFNNQGGNYGGQGGGFNNNWGGQQGGFDQQQSYGQQSYGAQPQQSYGGQQQQSGYGAGQQGSYGAGQQSYAAPYGNQTGYQQPADTSSYGGADQSQTQGWQQQQGQQQGWQQPNWQQQGQQPTGQFTGAGDYQQPAAGAYTAPRTGGWGGNYQQ